MSSTNVPNFTIVNHMEVEVDDKGRTIPKDLSEKQYYGDNSQMAEAIGQGDLVQVDAIGYEKFEGKSTTIIIDKQGKITGDLSKLSRDELKEIAEKYPDVLKADMEREDSR